MLLITKFILCSCCKVKVNQEQQYFNKRQLFSGQCYQISARSSFKNLISKGQSCQSLQCYNLLYSLKHADFHTYKTKFNPVGASPSPVASSHAV